MNTIKYSLKTHKNLALSPNFKVQEFANKDGSDEVVLAVRLVDVLEDIRKRCGNKPVKIVGGYKTPYSNEKAGGNAFRQHALGNAADIVIDGVSPKTVAQAAEVALMRHGIPGGVGLYDKVVHVDVQMDARRCWGEAEKPVYGFFPSLKLGDNGQAVRDVQERLNLVGLNLKIDGDFGSKTEEAVVFFQKSCLLSGDGIVGPKTWEVLEV